MAESERRDAVIYTRISRDKEGLSVGVQRQEDDCRALAKQLAVPVSNVYSDNDIGASTLSRKERPAFKQMLEEIRGGTVGVVIAYSNSRLTRRLLEFEDLIKLHEQTGVQFKTVVSGEDDLSTADGRMVARIKASVDAAEAERTGERLRAAHRHMALKGKPFTGGHRAFGWESDKLTLIPVEADLIRTAVASLTSGSASLTSVAAAWNELGMRSPKGNEWRHVTVKEVVTSPRLAGYRTYKGEIMRDESGEQVRGEWEPIITDDQRDALLVAMEGRVKSRRRAAKYLLTPMLMCGRCGAKMYGSRKNDGKDSFYRCSRTWHLTINAGALEQAVSNEVGIRLGKIYEYDKHRDPDEPEKNSDQEFAGEARIESLQIQNEELMERYNLGMMKGERVLPQIAANDREIDELLAEQRRWMAKTRRVPITFKEGDYFDLETWWWFSEESRNFLIRMACERIVVRPTGKERSLSPAERADIQWSWAVTPWDEGNEPDTPERDRLWIKRHAKQQGEARTRASVVNPKHARVKELLGINPSITGQMVADELGISRPYAQTLLRRVRQDNSSAP